jgi:hypothetical protein
MASPHPLARGRPGCVDQTRRTPGVRHDQTVTPSPIRSFEAAALYQALDARRAELGLNWSGVADQIWQLSADLNDSGAAIIRSAPRRSPAWLTSRGRAVSTLVNVALARTEPRELPGRRI